MSDPAEYQILIVEDDPDLALLLQRVLYLGGYTSCWAPDGARALELLALGPPRMLTLDMNMPGLSGPEVLQRIRATPCLARLPVLILTSREELPRRVVAQASAVIIKPFDIGALLGCVGDLVAAPRAREVGA